MKTFSSTLIKILLLVLPVITHAQQTVMDTLYDENTGEKSIFYVLKESGIKHGEYRTYIDTLLRGVAHFNNGLMDGPTARYSLQGKLLYSGSYKNDVAVGIWNYYSYGGVLISRINKDNDSVLYRIDANAIDFDYSLLKAARPTDSVTALQHALGKDSVNNFLSRQIVYPALERDNDIQGHVVITVTINPNGEAVNYQTEKMVSEGLSKEALRVVKLLPNGWLPATVNGKPVATYWHCSIRFALQ